ncbi:miraculin-like [Abrus precatorius]|uniref:Miraculin-like n=1 Tax=Abrus precatorius TaxID=3816 RepID=A0A8B8LSX4_ABRPR|nr:miraculin-like [Abrus precatorius]
MKITLLSLVLLVALGTKPLLGAAVASNELVLDTSGKKLRSGTNYYIIPASPNVGGIDLASTGKDCPLDVVAVDGYQGLPLIFIPYINTKKGIIRVSTDLKIYFPSRTSCPQNSVWRLKDYDYSTGQWFVTTSGDWGNPGRKTIKNWFKIEIYEDAYRLVYCPNVCYDCRRQCSDIGIYQDQYGKRLALSDVPYKVQFQIA